MTKTLPMNVAASLWDKPKYVKVTATKVDEIEAGVENLYRDEQGNEYIAGYNKFQRRYEFTKIREA